MQIWNSLLEFIGKLVSPDWAGLIDLLPVGMLLLVLLYLAWIVKRFATAGPTRHGGGRITPKAPAGIHLPGPSYAPVFGAVGVMALFYGLVFHGPWLVIGAVVLALSLLYWGREALRDYDRIEPEDTIALPAVVHTGPPAGVHMPGPSFRPIVSGVALAILLYGLVFGGALLAVGVIALIISLVEWLIDARRECTAVVVADATGHLENGPRPTWPKKTFATFAILVVGAVVVQAGIFPPASSAGGGTGTPGSSASPAASGSAAPPASSVAADVSITAQNIAFVEKTVTAPGGRAFTIAFTNDDAGIPHDVSIRKGSPTGDEVFKGAIFPGVATQVYNVPALPAGTYAFICDVHPTSMIGTLTVP
jgi:plastocyanin